ncbi:MAG: serine/threonine-protein phosphatase [Planctomycetes bacterium]|nr:serine/threonine-protein phosphatase [Planctomycetota bacterium]
MGLFGGKAKGRHRRLIEEELDAPAWQVVAAGEWVCPYCAQVGVKGFPDEEDDQVEAILEHLTDACPDFEDGEGEVRELRDLKRTADQRSLRKRVKRQLVKSRAWQLINTKRQWVCPYCAQATAVEISGDRRMDEGTLRKVIDHVHRCHAYAHGHGEERPYAELRASVKRDRKRSKLREEVRARLEGDPAWRRKTRDQRWVCPYCMVTQQHIDLSTHLLMFETAPMQIADHLLGCEAYRRGDEPQALGSETGSLSGSLSRTGGIALGGISEDAGWDESQVIRKSRSDDRRRLEDSSSGALTTSEITGSTSGQLLRTSRGTPISGEGPSDTGLLRDSSLGRTQPRPSQRAPRIQEARPAPPPRPEPKPKPKPEPEKPSSRKVGTTTLRDLHTSGEYTLINEVSAESRRKRSRAWRREIQRQLEVVNQWNPGLSGELNPPVEDEHASDVQRIDQRYRLEERGVLLRVIHHPAHTPRGDFVELFDLGPKRLGIAIGGTASDSVEAPIVAAMARNALRTIVGPEKQPPQVLDELNRELFSQFEGTFFTVVYALIDLPSLRVLVGRAGMAAPLLVNLGRAPRLQPVTCEGMLMGIDCGQVYTSSLKAQPVDLAPGDLLVLFNNGIVEARPAAHKEEFGVSRMHQLCERYGAHELAYFQEKFSEYYQAHHQPKAHFLTEAWIVALKRLDPARAHEESPY